jgi:hypothetical protein
MRSTRGNNLSLNIRGATKRSRFTTTMGIKKGIYLINIRITSRYRS